MNKNWNARAHLLISAITKAIQESNPAENGALKTLLNGYLQKIYAQSYVGLHQEIELQTRTQELINALEEKNLSPKLLKAFKENKIYEMVYHHPVLTGQYNSLPDDKKFEKLFAGLSHINPTGPFLIGVAQKGVIIAALSTALYLTTPFVTSALLLSVTSSLFAGSIAYLAGLSYGIINDLFATRFNLAYFLVGHQPQQKNLIISNDKNVQAIAWGVAATFLLSSIAAIVFAITVFFNGVNAPFILPLLLISTPFISLLAEGIARLSEHRYQQQGLEPFWLIRLTLKNDTELEGTLKKHCALSDEEISFIRKGEKIKSFSFAEKRFYTISKKLATLEELKHYQYLRVVSGYQLEVLKHTSNSPKAANRWFANSDRNTFGYLAVPSTAITALVLSITITNTPLFLLSPLFAVYLPALAATLAITGLGLSFNYALKNQEMQHDDRYKLHVERLLFVNTKKVGLFIEREDLTLKEKKIEALQKALSICCGLEVKERQGGFFSSQDNLVEQTITIQKLIRFYHGEELTFNEAEQEALLRGYAMKMLKKIAVTEAELKAELKAELLMQKTEDATPIPH